MRRWYHETGGDWRVGGGRLEEVYVLAGPAWHVTFMSVLTVHVCGGPTLATIGPTLGRHKLSTGRLSLIYAETHAWKATHMHGWSSMQHPNINIHGLNLNCRQSPYLLLRLDRLTLFSCHSCSQFLVSGKSGLLFILSCIWIAFELHLKSVNTSTHPTSWADTVWNPANELMRCFDIN